jgi:hypothetical protein
MAKQASRTPPAAAQPDAATGGAQGRTATVNLPFVTAQLRVPQLRAPHISAPHIPAPRIRAPQLPALPRPHRPAVGRREIGDAARGAASLLPPPRELVFYTGLGALGALGLVEWPVAAAIGAGTMIARRSARDERQAAAPTPEPAPSPEESARRRPAGRLTRRSTSTA